MPDHKDNQLGDFFCRPLISAQELATALDEHGNAIKLVDASWRMPGNPPAIDDYHQRHIPQAVFFDIDAIADRTSDLPHMLPTESAFAAHMAALGLGHDDPIVVYDDVGIFSAPRVWWTLKTFGATRVAVLDGGLPAWCAINGTLCNTQPSPKGAQFKAELDTPRIASDQDVQHAIKTNSPQIIDARASARFDGAAQEPREALRSGAMPGARNVPFERLLDDGHFKSVDELRDVFAAAGVDITSRAITSCGSGVTAAVISLALELVGAPPAQLYDGAWAQWGKDSHDPAQFPVVAAAQSHQ